MSGKRGEQSASAPEPGRQEDSSGASLAVPGRASRYGDESGIAVSADDTPPASSTAVGETPWTEDENEVLRLEYPHHGPTGTHAKLPHRSIESVRTQALHLGVHERHRPWTPGELECLKVVFPKGGAEGVQERLPERSLEAIRHKASDLGIKHDRRSATTIPVDEIMGALNAADGNVAKAARALACDAASLRRVATNQHLIEEKDPKPHWKVKEVEVLRAEYPNGGAPAVQAKIPNRSLHAIYRMAARLGLAGEPEE